MPDEVAIIREYRFGRQVEHDERSRGFPAAQAPVIRSVLHMAHGLPLDQGSLGSCTGNALVGALMSGPLYRPGRDLTERDAVAVYSRATQVDDIPGAYPPDDTGSSGLGVCKAAKAMGLISAYHHAFGQYETLLALMLQPVIIGIPWYSSMMRPRSSGLVSVGRGATVVGGHEVVLDGIDAQFRHVRAWNSWGPDWGLDGAFLLTWSMLGRLLEEQGDCTVPIS